MLAVVLATDMRVHEDFMRRFRDLLATDEAIGADGTEAVDEWVRRVTLCQALIKCADISNPVSSFSRGRVPPGVILQGFFLIVSLGPSSFVNIVSTSAGFTILGSGSSRGVVLPGRSGATSWPPSVCFGIWRCVDRG